MLPVESEAYRSHSMYPGKDSVTFRSFSENLLIPKEVDIHKKPGSASDILGMILLQRVFLLFNSIRYTYVSFPLY